jgi:site-specific DNA-methyltransferase (adenine-specific)
MLGDCLERMAGIETGSVDLTVTSPPYDNLRNYNGSLDDWTERKWQAVLRELFRVTKQGGVVVWVVADATIKGSETGTSFRQAIYAMECGFKLHDTMIWEKSTFSAVGALKHRYAPVFEYMFVFSKGAPQTFNPIKDRPNKHAGVTMHGTTRQKDGRTVTSNGAKTKAIIKDFGQRHNVWRINEEKVFNKTHPAVFPVALAQDHIISWSNLGDTVLDPFMGSGTTGVACMNKNRNFIGIERDPDYFRIAQDRIDGSRRLL